MFTKYAPDSCSTSGELASHTGVAAPSSTLTRRAWRGNQNNETRMTNPGAAP